MNQEESKKITDYFRGNIFEALSMYSAWKMLCFSKSKVEFSGELLKKYLDTQNYHHTFFQIAERSFLVGFVLLVLHPFDKREDSLSLYKVNRTKTEKFMEQNKDIIEKLKKVRNKVFAHKDGKSVLYKLPPVTDLNIFFENLIRFYNEITHEVDDSVTYFSNADEEVKRDIELMFMNIHRGEAMRKLGIDIEWMWEKDNKKASDVL